MELKTISTELAKREEQPTALAVWVEPCTAIEVRQ